MSQDLERIESRLENIRSAEPLLGALRTISMGSWRTARRKRESVQQYAARLKELLRWLVPYLPSERERQGEELVPANRVVLLVIGSERGLVGGFNRLLVERATRRLDGSDRGPPILAREDRPAGGETELWVLGGRPARLLQEAAHPAHRAQALPAASMPPFRLADRLTRRWLTRYEAAEIDGVDVLYNAYLGVGQYEPRTVRLIPPQVELGTGGGASEPWPPPIIETDPLGLYAQIVRQLTAITLYGLLLESATAEHSARYQLMEDATQNAERLIDELTMDMREAQRQATTQEMLLLVVGAGLLGRQKGRGRS